MSSSLDVAIPKGYTFAAEVGLSGELRNVPKMEPEKHDAFFEEEGLGITLLPYLHARKLSDDVFNLI